MVTAHLKIQLEKIWELADPVVSPAHTDGLIDTPNEIKLKHDSDNKFSDLKGDELKEAIKEEIRTKDKDLTGQMITEGKTPRVLADLISSLCDLIMVLEIKELLLYLSKDTLII